MEGFLRFMRNGGGKTFQTMLPPAVYIAGEMHAAAMPTIRKCILCTQLEAQHISYVAKASRLLLEALLQTSAILPRIRMLECA